MDRFSPRNSPRQSAIAGGFAEANSVFIVIKLQLFLQQKYCRGDYLLAKYIFSLQFLILISRQNYRLQTKDIIDMCQRSICARATRSQIYYIYFRQFIHPLSLMFLSSFFHSIFFRSRTRRYRVSNSCSNVLISMILFGRKRECQSFDVCPRQHSHNFCYLMIVLVRGVLSAKLVLRYKHKFEAILQALSQN